MAVFIAAAFAGEPWNTSLDFNLNLALGNYSGNWDGGEAGSFNWTVNANFLAERQIVSWLNYKHTAKLSFGQTHSQSVETRRWAVPQIATDLIDIEDVARFTLGTFVDPYAAVRLESQFYDTRVADNKRYFNPIKLTESTGFAREFIKEENRELISRLGFGIREYVDRDVMIAADEYETQTANDGGIEFVTELRMPLAKEKISYTGKLTIFEALFYSESDALAGLPNEDYWKAPDVAWENIFAANITEHIMVNLYFELLYDKEISLKGRHKETLALGLTYNAF